MKSFVYYPGFEVRNENWLKFALLYLEQLNPIIPLAGYRYLTDEFRMLNNETDLIRRHRPNQSEGENATRIAIEALENVIKHPKLYENIFNTPNVVEDWRNPETKSYELFYDKYSDSWQEFCFEYGFAHDTAEGILVPESLGQVYMTMLAQVIAESQGMSTITDRSDLDKFSILARKTNNIIKRKNRIAQAVIDLQVPGNLEEISLDEIIKFRNREGFRTRLTSFHEELDNYLSKVERGETAGAFVNQFRSIFNEFTDEILKLGLGTFSFGLGIWILANAPEIGSEEFIQQVVSGWTLVLGSSVGINKSWRNTDSKFYTRKYLTELKKLRPTQF